MSEYLVQVDNEESNVLADVISITGRVNGIQSAAKVRISLLEKLPKAKHKQVKQKALVQAFLERGAIPATDGAEKVTL